MNGWIEVSGTVVMPAQCDQYGHLNVRHYAAIFNDSAWHMLGLAGISLADINARGLGTVVASLTIDFHREIKAGQLVLIKAAVTRVGAKSFSHQMRMYEGDSMTHCATQKSVEVCFDMAARAAAVLPDDMRSKLTAIVVSD